jgi:hypothetical protein
MGMQDDLLDRFLRSCSLVRASWEVLRSDRELLIFPVISIGSTVLVLFNWAMFAWWLGIKIPEVEQGKTLEAMQADPIFFGWVFVAYLLGYFIAFYFNTALVGAALQKLEGGNPTVGSALALASQRVGAIFGYALISATIGILMATIVERIGGILGRLIGGGLSFAWTLMTFLVVPILAAQNVGPITAIGESASLLRKTWGENLIGNVGISLAMSVIGIAILITGVVFGIGFSRQGYPQLLIPIFGCTAFLVAMSALMGSALRGIYVAAVYHYAVVGEPPWGFDRGALKGAFTQKGP